MKSFSKIQQALQENLPFVSYSKPNSNSINTFIQNNNTIYTTTNLTESGFIFAPFNTKETSILIPFNNSIFLEEPLNKLETNLNFKNTNTSENNSFAKEAHIELVKKGINAIKNKLFKKVVLSRKETIKETTLNSLNIFKTLLQLYPSAMVYIWHHPSIGLWLGATPETLLKTKKNSFETMSLAGTQVFKNGTITWQQKEINEQQFVTDYIAKKLQSISSNLNIATTKTIKAGNLAHLQTKITGNYIDNFEKIVKTLHPTPAVCGLPQQSSQNFILKNENYNRSFYTGYLGELHLNNSSNLYVNLRCMQIETNAVNIYVGGGITQNSNAEKEWEETVAKSLTMKKALSN